MILLFVIIDYNHILFNHHFLSPLMASQVSPKASHSLTVSRSSSTIQYSFTLQYYSNIMFNVSLLLISITLDLSQRIWRWGWGQGLDHLCHCFFTSTVAKVPIRE